MRSSAVLLLLILLIASACSTQRSTLTTVPLHNSTKKASERTVKRPTADARILVRFEPDSRMKDAIEKAQAGDKMIFLDFFADYCPPCKLMDKEVFGDRNFADLLNSNFVNVKVDVGQQEGANLASLFEVKALPTLLFTDQNGKVLIRKEGGASLTQMQAMAMDVLKSTAMK